MPLGQPPSPATLEHLPRWQVRDRTLHRIYRADRVTAWWFASLPGPAVDPDAHGRFDLPAPDGACYLGLTAVAAVLETFQHFTGLLPDVELRARRRAQVRTPRSAPAAADLAAAPARAGGVTAALWAGGDRALTQLWAQQLRRAGWRALHHGIAHDPAGRLRAVTLFDSAGEHQPYDDDDGWQVDVHTLHDDEVLHRGLRRFGITVSPSDPQLAVIPLDQTDLLDPQG
jgi:hypothetical protein